MPELLIFLFAFAVLGCLLVALVLSISAHVRMRRQGRLIEDLREQLSDLRRARAAEPKPVHEPIRPAPPPPVRAPEPPTIVVSDEIHEPELVLAPPPPPPRAMPREALAPAPVRKVRVPIEKLIGVQGAAILGGIILAIAGVYLFVLSIEKGWITPNLRIWMGLVAGGLCLLGSGPLRKRGYVVTGDALAGGGVVALYAATWAAHQLFGLWPVAVSFGGMVAITIGCSLLALRRSSQLIATLGLLGGFATPIALSSNRDNPIGLFGYVLLVNLGFLSVAHKRRWPALGIVGLLGTFVIEGLWIFGRMRDDTFWIALVALAVFALLFVVFTALQPSSERARWAVSQVGALLLPFVFALYFVVQTDTKIGYHLVPSAVLAALIAACSGWLARRQGLALVPLGTATGCVALVLVWVLRQEPGTERLWELALCCAGLALVQLVHLELVQRGPPEEAGLGSARQQASLATGLSAGGLGIALWISVAQGAPAHFTPWFVGLAALALVLARQSALVGRAWFTWAAAIPLGLALWTWANQGVPEAGSLLSAEPGLWILAATALFFAVEWLRRASPQRAGATHAQAIVLALGLLALNDAPSPADEQLPLAVLGVGLIGLLLLSAARRVPSTVWFAVAAVLTLYVQDMLITPRPLQSMPSSEQLELIGCLLLTTGGMLGFAQRGWLDTRNLARLRPFSALLGFSLLRQLCLAWTGQTWRGLPALVLAVIVGAAWLWTRGSPRAAVERAPNALWQRFALQLSWPPGQAPASALATARVWFLSIALALALSSVPLQLDHDWLPLALAFTGAGLAWLALRERHLPLALVSATLILMATAGLYLSRLGVTSAVYPNAVWNWLVWIFVAPAVAATGAALWLGGLRAQLTAPASNVARVCATLCGIAAVALLFAWINLAILNAFDTPPSFRWLHERVPSRDLSLSLAWAVYALALLILGVSRRATGLRWISLILFLITIAKVFLLDLGHLTDLYRVASLLGLALSLLGVSLLYQRFVFRRAPAEADAPTEPS